MLQFIVGGLNNKNEDFNVSFKDGSISICATTLRHQGLAAKQTLSSISSDFTASPYCSLSPLNTQQLPLFNLTMYKIETLQDMATN